MNKNNEDLGWNCYQSASLSSGVSPLRSKWNETKLMSCKYSSVLHYEVKEIAKQ